MTMIAMSRSVSILYYNMPIILLCCCVSMIVKNKVKFVYCIATLSTEAGTRVIIKVSGHQDFRITHTGCVVFAHWHTIT